MKKYTQLTYEELVKIETLMDEKISTTEIAIRLGRNKSTIYRVIKNNTKQDELFNANISFEKIKDRKLNSSKPRRILSDSILEHYIIEKIEEYWSPEQISSTWKSETKEALSHDTIYQYIYKHKRNLIKLYFRRKGKKYQPDRKSKYQILNRRMIDDRPKHIEKRIEAGHWEGDTIIGKNHKGAIITNVERKSGKLIATKVSNKTAQAILNATVLDFKDLPASLCVTMTYDNGKEFSFHKDIEDQTNFTVYFAHAYSPWERGTNENTNGLLRQFIPKGTDFDNVTDEDLQKYVNLINNRPRKRHGFKSPNYIFQLELDKVALETGI